MNDNYGNDFGNGVNNTTNDAMDIDALANPELKANFFGGILGAVVAGALGALGWFLIVKITGYEVGYAAWGVGALVGIGTRICAKLPSKTLGVLAGIIAVVAILAGSYAALHVAINEELPKQLQIIYESELEFARKIEQTKTTEGVRKIILEIAREDDPTKVAKDITQEDEEVFEEETRPYYEKLLAGDPSKEQFIEECLAISRTLPKKDLIIESLSLWTLLWAVLGIGSAYKIASGHKEG